MKLKILKIFFATFLYCTCNIVIADIIDNFSAAKQHGSEVFSQSRTWYSFGGIAIRGENNKLTATGNSDTWAGFGIDPGASGKNGAPISTKGFKNIIVDIKGVASGVKLELYDEQYVKYEIWIDLTNVPQGGFTSELPSDLLGKKIAKMQFVFSPGKIDVQLNSISLQ